ncbi:hypothetical protein LRP30_07215 [Bradyrhizobium sp. C-145]|uniref:hypothetical protein n=1 Tax=Bradyrhizobium sp. C-145 TaxID=574727 RepID=UPI00201B49DA|nr:hypothetical protein [Bradyrhizobium sp. C-145]UQR65043.1 hypothetical protein LRP30_07215 [Bradyrhizobium sp. C-145]
MFGEPNADHVAGLQSLLDRPAAAPVNWRVRSVRLLADLPGAAAAVHLDRKQKPLRHSVDRCSSVFPKVVAGDHFFAKTAFEKLTGAKMLLFVLDEGQLP